MTDGPFRSIRMIPSQLDAIFPFILFFYGALLTIVLHQKHLVNLAEKRMPHSVIEQMKSHRVLALISLILGFFWSLQGLWFS